MWPTCTGAMTMSKSSSFTCVEREGWSRNGMLWPKQPTLAFLDHLFTVWYLYVFWAGATAVSELARGCAATLGLCSGLC